jgi:ribosomal protein L37AE/L43A
MYVCSACGRENEDSLWDCVACGRTPTGISGFPAFAPELAAGNEGFEAEY